MPSLTDSALETGWSDLPLSHPPSDRSPHAPSGSAAVDRGWQMESPIGPIWVAASGVGITAVDRAEAPERFMTSYRLRFGRALEITGAPLDRLARKVARWLDGDRRSLPPFDLSQATPFEAAVLRKTLEIPRGQVRTYGWMAQAIGHPGASRAVGSALAGNPIPLLIPCHRVIREDGVIGNYLFGSETKRALLQDERVDLERLESLGKQGIRYTGSDTTHIFCLPTCRYKPAPHHLQFFHSEAEARARGYRPCKVCQPAPAA